MVKKIFQKFDLIINFFEKSPLSINSWMISFFSIIAARFTLELLVIGFPKKNIDEFFGSLIHGTFLFFLCSYLVLWIFIYFLTREKLSIIARVLLWGQWLIVLPPIVDKIIFKNKPYWSYYLFDGMGGLVSRLFQFFGPNPSMGITWGTRTMVLLASIALGYYIYTKKEKIYWFFVGTVLVYGLLFLLAAIPSLISFCILPFQGISLGDIESHHIAKIFLTENTVFGIKNAGIRVVLHLKLALFYNLLLFVVLLILQFLKNKEQFFAIFQNIRLPQMIFNWGLFLIGIGLGWYYFPKNFSINIFSFLTIANGMLAVLYAWTYSVFVNDLEDVKTDSITNNWRPLIQNKFSISEFFEYSYVFAGLALLSAFVVSKAMFGLVVAYLLITWVYSCYPFRFKRFVVIASLLSSFVSLLFLIAGYVLISDNQSLLLFPWKIIFFLFIVYVLTIPIKDLKDIEGDKADDVITLPVLLGEENSRLLLGTILFVSYLISVTIIGEPSLLVAAFIFGTISFWVVVNKKNNPRILPWWVLVIVAVYAILIIMSMFD